MSLKTTVLLSVLVFSLLSIFLFVQHELQATYRENGGHDGGGSSGAAGLASNGLASKSNLLRKNKNKKKKAVVTPMSPKAQLEGLSQMYEKVEDGSEGNGLGGNSETTSLEGDIEDIEKFLAEKERKEEEEWDGKEEVGEEEGLVEREGETGLSAEIEKEEETGISAEVSPKAKEIDSLGSSAQSVLNAASTSETDKIKGGNSEESEVEESAAHIDDDDEEPEESLDITLDFATIHEQQGKTTVNFPLQDKGIDPIKGPNLFEMDDDDGKDVQGNSNSSSSSSSSSASSEEALQTEKRGILKCNGKIVDSEVIYWKQVPGDQTFESPITPHHDNHHDRYLSFEYDNGGWNNVRMGMECIIVIAHAMGRTLVIPPSQHLYLLGKTHQDKHDEKPHDEMGFEDFFDLDLLRSHQGFHMITMEEFLANEAVTGGLKGTLPKHNKTDLWGAELWHYLHQVADYTPEWMGKYMAFPDRPGDFDLSEVHHPKTKERMTAFAGERAPVFYDEKMQSYHHIHVPGDNTHRILQHHYAFAFFANPTMQSFYRRFVRDFMRYKDEIQCHGAELVKAVREDSLRENPEGEGAYYALHVRRGDFQFKDVKIEASQIVENLNFTVVDPSTGIELPLIPSGSIVYLSTDDPDGTCRDCLVQRKPCTEYPKGSKPIGCPEDPSWDAMKRAGWKLRLLRDYTSKGVLKGVNPNLLGMVESIVCSRAKAFAGTYFSTFTGYIHRLRGFHGLGESTYYHTTAFVKHPQMKKSVGHGFSREWRAGWTDDGGELI